MVGFKKKWHFIDGIHIIRHWLTLVPSLKSWSLDIVSVQLITTWHFCLPCRCVPTDVWTAETDGVSAATISLHLPILFCLHRLHSPDSCSKGTFHKSKYHCLPTNTVKTFLKTILVTPAPLSLAVSCTQLISGRMSTCYWCWSYHVQTLNYVHWTVT